MSTTFIELYCPKLPFRNKLHSKGNSELYSRFRPIETLWRCARNTIPLTKRKWVAGGLTQKNFPCTYFPTRVAFSSGARTCTTALHWSWTTFIRWWEGNGRKRFNPFSGCFGVRYAFLQWLTCWLTNRCVNTSMSKRRCWDRWGVVRGHGRCGCR